MIRSLFYRWLYGPLMRIAHRYHWHYAPPIYPEGETQIWCQWCGFRQTIKRRGDKAVVSNGGGGTTPTAGGRSGGGMI